MGAMRSATRAGPFTAAELAALPDDGHLYEVVDGVLYGYRFTRAERDARSDDGRRHELIDGTLVVTPAPAWRHQDVVLSLATLLRAACPAELKVFVAPLDVTLGGLTVVEPDVLVVPRSALGERVLVGLPSLAMEVLSPSTRRLDLTRKRSRYEEAGVASYWVIDPDEPRLIAWDLGDGAYVQVADICGTEAYDAALPFPVTVVPQDVVAD